MSIYDYSFIDNSGKEVQMSSFKDKTILIVNVASKCGLTEQYQELEALNKKLSGKDFVLIGFPCNQFANQEPGSNEEIAEFCKTNFDVTFTLASKIDVNGDGSHPIYKYLKEVSKNGEDIAWNFEKFIILKNGNVYNFDPQKRVADFESVIVESL
jgi:glutathione peroxidase